MNSKRRIPNAISSQVWVMALPGSHESTTVKTATTRHGNRDGDKDRGSAQGLLGKRLKL